MYKNTMHLTKKVRQIFPLFGNYAWSRGYKTFFMLNTAEHKTDTAHKYRNNPNILKLKV